MDLTISTWFNPITILIGIISFVIIFVKYKLTYWQRKGLMSYKSQFFIGHMGRLVAQKETFAEHIKFHYDYLKSKNQVHGGEYFFLKPFYIPVDPLIIKHIMQVDFSYFVDRGMYHHERDPLSMNLFFIEGDKWKNLRAKLTPTFTSGKLRMMFDTLIECTNQLRIELDKHVGEPLEVKDILGRFTTDVIGSVAFGIDCNSLKNPDGKFRAYAQQFFKQSVLENFKGILTFIIPEFMDYFEPNVVPSYISEFFINIIKNTVDYREKNNYKRKDFMDLLIQLKNSGRLDNEQLYTSNESTNRITFNELAAQAFVFFIAGYETSSTTMTFALYELAKNPDIQNKLRESIKEVLKKHDGKLTYEAVTEMTYLEQVVNESLRMYPALPNLSRICVKDYKVPNTDFTIEKGTKINIPLQGLQMDPEYFPNPEKFDPERFSEQNKKNIKPFTYLPFGEGPRICIGERFGKLQTKAGLIVILNNYKFSLNNTTKQPLEMDTQSFIPNPKGGVWIDYQRID